MRTVYGHGACRGLTGATLARPAQRPDTKSAAAGGASPHTQQEDN